MLPVVNARTLHVTSPLMSGTDVLALQTRLSVLGYHPGPLDGQYGVATSRAVAAFQKRSGLAVDGIAGPKTFAALKAPKPNPPAPHPSSSHDVGVLALCEALKHLGVKEHPAGSNRTPFGPALGMPDGVYWCAEFTSFCTFVGAKYVLAGAGSKPPCHGAGAYAKGNTYVPTIEAWMRTNGMWVGRSQPQPGFVAIYNWDGGVPDHIGIVEKYLGGGKFTAIEGNTSVGNDSNGGEVMRRTRYLTQVDGFGHLA